MISAVENKQIQKASGIGTLLPILFGFFIMGFVDVVGIATNYVKKDFALSDTLASLLPMAVFLWFLIFSVPTGMLMNKIGRKSTVLLSMVITAIGLIIPVFAYTLPVVMIAFALIGIGNTLIQVALNPLLANVVRKDRLTSNLTIGQFIKAISSFLGPVIAAFAATGFNNWHLLFPIFSGITVLSFVWLLATPITEERNKETTTSIGECFALLADKKIFLCFLGILTLVGIDVGINITAPKILMETGMPLEKAGYATSLYFVCRTAGSFFGAFILAKYSSSKFYVITAIAAIIAFAGLLLSKNTDIIYVCIAAAGLACANMFSIIFSFALQCKPEKSNEISGLMIMGVSGGAFFPFLMGVSSDAFHGQRGALLVLLVCCMYQLFLSIATRKG